MSLNEEQQRVLKALYRHYKRTGGKSITLRDLYRRMNSDMHTISSVVAQLKDRKLCEVKRWHANNNVRVMLVWITDLGLNVITQKEK